MCSWHTKIQDLKSYLPQKLQNLWEIFDIRNCKVVHTADELCTDYRTMPVTIGSNIAALKAQRQLGLASDGLSRSFERLSSGLRINRAADDAAGLSVSASLKSASRVYTQAIRNGNDGLSLLAIADQALAQLSDLATRQLELAEQAANGSYSFTQRQALAAEANALVSEFNRIVESTQFNGKSLLTGQLSSELAGTDLRLQLGYGINGSISFGVGAELARTVGDGTFGSAATYRTNVEPDPTETLAVSFADMNGDGNVDMVTVGSKDMGIFQNTTIMLGNGDGSFEDPIESSMAASGNAVTTGDMNNDGNMDAILLSAGQANILYGNGTGNISSSTLVAGSLANFSITTADVNGDNHLDIVTGGAGGPNGYASVVLSNGNGTYQSAVSYLMGATTAYDLAVDDLNRDGNVDIITVGSGYVSYRLGTGSGTFGSVVSYAMAANTEEVSVSDLNGDGWLDIVSGRVSGNVVATVRLNNGGGTFGAAVSYVLGAGAGSLVALSASDINGDGIPDVVATTGTDAYVGIGQGNGSIGSTTTFSLSAIGAYDAGVVDVNNDGAADFVAVGDDTSTALAEVHLADTEEVTSVGRLDLFTQEAAQEAITLLRSALSRISSERGVVGAIQSRLDASLRTLQATRENYDQAHSRITDADIAVESAQMIRQQIMQQSASAVLGQANFQPEMVLKLLSY